MTPKGQTNWERLEVMTEDEIHQNALDDQFAKRYHLSIKNIQEWEQGRRVPQGPSQLLLIAIKNDPEAVRKAIEQG